METGQQHATVGGIASAGFAVCHEAALQGWFTSASSRRAKRGVDSASRLCT